MPSRPLLGLQDRWVVVTGSTRGIGHATAHAFGAAGANVVVTSRHQDAARDVAAEIAEAHGVEVLAVACDVSDAASVAELFERVDEVAEAPDVLVNNAGYPWRRDRWETDIHELGDEEVTAWFDEVRAVDLQGARLATREALRRMVPRRHGVVLYVASTPALAGHRGTPYTEAKAAVLGLMRDVARTYGPHGIRANAVALGNISTAAMKDATDAEQAAQAAETALGRLGTPEDAAGALVFLGSDLARFVTGQTLVVDGGTEMR